MFWILFLPSNNTSRNFRISKNVWPCPLYFMQKCFNEYKQLPNHFQQYYFGKSDIISHLENCGACVYHEFWSFGIWCFGSLECRNSESSFLFFCCSKSSELSNVWTLKLLKFQSFFETLEFRNFELLEYIILIIYDRTIH